MLHIKKHGDAGRSLAAMTAGCAIRESLAKIGDADVLASLTQLGRRRPKWATMQTELRVMPWAFLQPGVSGSVCSGLTRAEVWVRSSSPSIPNCTARWH